MSARVRSISVLMPTYQGVRYLDRVLDALATQRTDASWDFTAVDCGSTDGTLELFAERARTFPVPLRVRHIHKCEFNHGDTRNLLAALSQGELLVFLTDDAIPVSADWLEQLARNFDDPRVGGAYCRNVPRPEANLLTKIFSENDPNYASGRRETRLPPAETYQRMEPEQLRELYSYCDTASAMRRELWRRHPYPRCEGMEDLLMARALLEAGHAIVYDDEALVQHSHEYAADRTHARARVDGTINAEWLDRVALASLEEVRELVDRQLHRDRAALEAAGLDAGQVQFELQEAIALRRAYYQGLYEGGLSTRRLRPTRMLELPCLRIMHVGSEEQGPDCAGALARAMRERGHEFELCQGSAAALARLSQEPPDVLHADSKVRLCADLLSKARELAVPVLVDCDGVPDEFLRRAASLFVCSDPETYAKVRALEDLHPDVVVAALPKRDCEPIDEWEYRYRAVACHRPDRASHILMKRRAAAAKTRSGEVVPQGAHSLLLRKIPSAVEYDLDLARGGSFMIRLAIHTLANERELVFGGRVLIDGVVRGVMHPFTATPGEDDLRMLSIPAEIPLEAKTLRIENTLFEGGPVHALRLQTIEIVELGRNTLDLTAPQACSIEGHALQQGPDMMMMGPGPASLEFALEHVGPGPTDLTLTVQFERDEAGVEFAGRLLLDGLPLARIGPLFGGGAGETHVLMQRVSLAAGAQRLRIENRKRQRGSAKLLRIKRLVVAPLLGAVSEQARGTPAAAFGALTRLRARLDLPRPLGRRSLG